jgi:hypothetical protein
VKSKKASGRFPLLLYRRTMDRMWILTLILGLLLIVVAGWALVNETILFGMSSNIWLFAAAVVALALSVFAFMARFVAYLQIFSSYLRVVTPFLRLTISFRRVRSIHPTLVQQLFPPKESSWSQRSFLEPFYGKTAVVVELSEYPMNPALLRLFLPAQMFSPHFTGLVFLVPDWMKLSTELDSFYGAWLQGQGGRTKPGASRRRG